MPLCSIHPVSCVTDTAREANRAFSDQDKAFSTQTHIVRPDFLDRSFKNRFLLPWNLTELWGAVEHNTSFPGDGLLEETVLSEEPSGPNREREMHSMVNRKSSYKDFVTVTGDWSKERLDEKA